MKINIEATQEELDLKRPELIKALTGKKFKVKIRPINEKLASEAREPIYRAQKEMLDYYNAEFKKLLEEIKKDIDEVVK